MSGSTDGLSEALGTRVGLFPTLFYSPLCYYSYHGMLEEVGLKGLPQCLHLHYHSFQSFGHREILLQSVYNYYLPFSSQGVQDKRNPHLSHKTRVAGSEAWPWKSVWCAWSALGLREMVRLCASPKAY